MLRRSLERLLGHPDLDHDALAALSTRFDALEGALRSVEQRLHPPAQPVRQETAPVRPSCYVGDHRILTMTNRGDRMYLDSRDIAITPGILCYGGWEDGTTALLDRFLKPGMAWVDIGANCGYFTVIGHRLVRAGGADGRTIAFEISPDNFRLCVDNLALTWMSEGSHVERMAVYSEDRDALSFQLFRKYGTNSGLCGVSNQYADYIGERPATETVPATTLDGYFANRPVPDFIKIDIEGGEWHALEGARHLIAAQRDLRLLIEWSPAQLTSCGSDPRALAELFPALGLKCFNAESAMTPLSVADCLAIDRTTMFLLSRTDPE
jgi:FkbM family methyltransferase